MNNAIYRVPLDIHSTSSQAVLSFKKNDSARKIYFSLTECGRAYNIAENCTAVFRAKKPDGTVLYNSCTISGNLIEYTLTNQTSAAVGRLDCEVTLYGFDNTQITSPRFIISIEDTVGSDTEIESHNEFTALSTVLTEAKNLNISVSGNTITVTGKDGVEKVIELKDGEPGPKGDDGISVVGVLVNAQNHLIITLSDSSTVDAGDIGVDAAVDNKLTEQKGAPGGLAELDANKRLPESQLPYFVLNTSIGAEKVNEQLAEIYQHLERNNALVAVLDESGYHYDTHAYRSGRYLIIEYFVFNEMDGDSYCQIKWDSTTKEYITIYSNACIISDTGWDDAEAYGVKAPTAYMIDKRKQDKIADLEAIRSGAAAGAKAIPAEQKGSAKGVAELDENGKVPSAQLPSYVDDVLEYTNQSAFPTEGESGKIYIAQDTNKTYRWGGTAYAEISASLALGETSSTAYRGDKGKAAYEHSQKTSGNPHGVTKADIGLNNVDNTSDLDKPVSVLQKAAIDAKYTLPTGGIPKADLAQEVQTSLEKADSASRDLASLTLGIHTDGLIYIFNNGKPIGTGIEMVGGASGDVVGFVDAENNIVITGSLPKGAYTLKYEMEDGSLVDVGIIDLTSGTSSYTNLADPNSEDWLTDMRLATNYGYGKANVGSIFTNYIPAQRGDVLRVKGLNLFGKANSQHSAIAIYSSEDKTANDIGKYNAYHGYVYTDMTSDISGEGAKDDISFNNDIYTYTILLHGGAQTITGATINYVRISAPLAVGYTSDDVIITVNEEIV